LHRKGLGDAERATTLPYPMIRKIEKKRKNIYSEKI